MIISVCPVWPNPLLALSNILWIVVYKEKYPINKKVICVLKLCWSNIKWMSCLIPQFNTHFFRYTIVTLIAATWLRQPIFSTNTITLNQKEEESLCEWYMMWVTLQIQCSQQHILCAEHTASWRYWGICVVFPEPVSSSIISTWKK